MKYNKEKVEAAKILFAEILELNQKLPEDRWVDVALSGGPYPSIEVGFWEKQRTGGFFFADGDSLLYVHLTGRSQESFTDITAKMQEWKELYCNE